MFIDSKVIKIIKSGKTIFIICLNICKDQYYLRKWIVDARSSCDWYICFSHWNWKFSYYTPNFYQQSECSRL